MKKIFFLVFLLLALPLFAEQTPLQKKMQKMYIHAEIISNAAEGVLKDYDQTVYDLFIENIYKRIDSSDSWDLKMILKDIVRNLSHSWLHSMNNLKRYTNEEFWYSIVLPQTLTAWWWDMTQYDTIVTELPVPWYEWKAQYVWIWWYEKDRTYTVEDWPFWTTVYKIENEDDLEDFMYLVCWEDYSIAWYQEWIHEHYFAWIKNSYLSVEEEAPEEAWWCVWPWRWSIRRYQDRNIAVYHWSVHAVDVEYVLKNEDGSILSETTIPYFQASNIFFR